jgi:hypothetical protein
LLVYYMIKYLSSISVLCNYIVIPMIFKDLIELRDIWMSCFPKYFQLINQSILISFWFNRLFLYQFDSDLLFGVSMSCYFDFIKCSLSDCFTDYIVSYLFLILFGISIIPLYWHIWIVIDINNIKTNLSNYVAETSER